MNQSISLSPRSALSVPPEAENPTTLAKFSRLPAEIRLSIWRLIGDQPRNLDIWQRRLGHLAQEYDNCLITRWVTLSAIPPILHACRESRAVGLEFYHLAFGSDNKLPHGVTITTEPRIYVNWNRDRILPMQAEKWEHAAYHTLACSDEGIGMQTVGIRANHHTPGSSWTLLSRSPNMNEVLIYYDPFIFYDRLKSRMLTIEFEEVTGIDLMSNAEKKAINEKFDGAEEYEKWRNEEVAEALKEGTPVSKWLENDGMGSWKRPDVRLGRLAIYGKERNKIDSDYERWSGGYGWVQADADLSLLDEPPIIMD